jgi:hypothetical protein
MSRSSTESQREGGEDICAKLLSLYGGGLAIAFDEHDINQKENLEYGGSCVKKS